MSDSQPTPRGRGPGAPLGAPGTPTPRPKPDPAGGGSGSTPPAGGGAGPARTDPPRTDPPRTDPPRTTAGGPRPVHRAPDEVGLRAYARALEVGDRRALGHLRRDHPDLASEFDALDNAWSRLSPYLGRATATATQPAGGADVDPGISLDRRPGTPLPAEGPQAGPLLDRIAARCVPPERYTARREIARGGMGSIQSVWDDDLRRHLVMKVMMRPQDRDPDAVSRPPDSRQVSRFLEEAQITSQLDHPSIVPVHDIGIDEHSRLYFTMPLVQGEDLGRVIAKARAGEEGWTRTRVLNVLVKVMEAVAFAHSRGVVHRDLKPENIMVGRFGQTYVMDWGLARVLDEARAEGGRGRSTLDVIRERVKRGAERRRRPLVRTERSGGAAGSSSVDTLDGDVVGTPGYMAPEQARGQRDRIGARTDIYAIGAILYQLLTGYRPFDDPVSRESGSPLFERILESEPVDIRALERNCPDELVAITRMAMQPDPDDRYGSMLAMIEDLRAYLEGHVVRAYEVGLLAEVRKWIVRNRVLASTIGAAAAAVITLIVLFVWQQQQNLDDVLAEQALTDAARKQAEAERVIAQSQREEALAAERAAEQARMEEQRARSAAEEAATRAQELSLLAQNRGNELQQINDRLRERELVQRRLRYAATLRAADIALAANDMAEARRLLAACEESLRGWEWEYLEQRVDLSLASLELTRDPLALAPVDASRIAVLTTGERLVVRDFDDERRRETWRLRAEPRAFAYDAPAGRFVVAHGPGPLTVLRLGVPGEERRLLDPTDLRLEFGPLSLAPDGGRVAAGVTGSGSAGRERTLTIFDVRTGYPVGIVGQRRARAVTAVCWSPDAAWIAVGLDDGAVQLVDAHDFRLVEELDLGRGAVTDLAFSSDSFKLACSASGDSAAVVDVAARTVMFSLIGHEMDVNAAAFGPEDRWIATASADRTIRVWDAYDGALRATLNGHDKPVLDLAVEAETGRIVSVDDGRTARAWDPMAGESSTAIDLRRGRDSAWIEFSPDGRRLVVPSSFSAEILDLDTLEPVASIGGGIFLNGGARHTPDGALAIAPSLTDLLAWDAVTGERVGHVGCLPRQFSKFELAADGTLAVASGPTWTFHTLIDADRPTPEVVAVWLDPVDGIVDERPPGQDANSLDADYATSLPDGVEALDLLPVPGRRQVLVACSDGRVRLYGLGAVGTGALERLATLTPTRTLAWEALGHGAQRLQAYLESLGGAGFHLRRPLLRAPAARCLALDVDSGTLAVGRQDSTVDLWTLATHTLRATLVGHESDVTAVDFSPDGKRLLTASTDTSLRLWDVALGETLVALRQHTGAVLDACFAPDGSRIASVGADDVARLWETDPPYARFDAQRVAEALRSDARSYLLGVLDNFVSTTELMERISDDPSLTEPLRERVAAYVRSYGENATRLSNDAWSVVQLPDAEPDEYQDALAWARFACSLEPDRDIFMRTLGVAQFRNGQYEACVETLEASGALHRTGPRPEELAVLAMAYAELGEDGLSRERRAAFDERMERPVWARNRLCQGFDRELRERLGSPQPGAADSAQGR